LRAWVTCRARKYGSSGFFGGAAYALEHDQAGIAAHL
jgi:hypothetical protein